ncbi:substrate-binding domain-containing protein [Vibrio sp. Makdt]|jgi:ribose transport system substrate-binding protein|uniref:substrate-binding domain-containing protein n=1 Tax=Vibrio sp. Makdt TaxID=2998828 RepID=UPI0022CD690C|nr:substrate-binding domain-containing protein [Vibrio sp. Makdt]MDA0151392.1 substrate-binding domain-containing protein [Vibrio sp. Makdt]
MNKIFNFASALLAITCSSTSFAGYPEDVFFKYAENKVTRAVSYQTTWGGPTAGPAIRHEKSIIFVASDLRNGGVYGVGKGLSEAISKIDWHLRFVDGLGSEVRQGAAIRKAIGFQPDAIVLGGIDAVRHQKILKQAQDLGITIIGWHATELAGGNPEIGLFTNITTDPLDVAEIAALLSIVNSKGQAKIVVFTDPNYEIAMIKANAMVDTIKQCRQCDVLELIYLPLDQIDQKMPSTLKMLDKKYGDNITHILAINDLYIDYAIPSLESKIEDKKLIPNNISAGDGSKAAYKRINRDKFQSATVPEPLYLQGWQIVDELNRAFNNMPPSGYSAPVHLVTPKNVAELINNETTGIYDPKNGYREAYLNIWKPQ